MTEPGQDFVDNPDFLAKPVLVAGASGFMGSHITRLLVEQGRKVRVLLRKTSNRAALEGLPVEVHYGDVLDPASLRAAMDGCGSVFYSVVDPRFWLTDPTPIYRNNVEGLVNAMEAALACGIERFIFTSSMGTLGFNPNGPVTEDIPFNWRDQASPYILARLEAEERLLDYCRSRGLPGVALCVANTYGPQDYQPTPHNGMLWEIASGRAKATLDASAPCVDIRDAAGAALLAETRGRLGERYIIANEYISNRDFFTLAAAQCGNKPPRVIPLGLARCIAWIAERVLTLLGKKDFLLRTDAVFLSNAFKELDNSKARRELGWNPRPVAETIRDAVTWFAAREAESQAR
ncbi:MAG: NAD-dependent epimerase/dehydratase family protein [Bacteroidales bacterium]|nr:NAD-dependent epimerase/dehydratase family protein [Bacteroidales bacterium]